MIDLRRALFHQHGMVLVSSLLLLLVVTILAVSMFRSFGVDEKIAGNTRDKQLAIQAAQGAEQYAENWLASNMSQSALASVGAPNPLATINCPAGMVAAAATQICTKGLATPGTLPWASGVKYSPPTFNVPGAPKLSSPPVFYIYALSTLASPYQYQIDAVGYGTSPNTVAVVEVIYSLKCLNCP
jgi:type IV pilus assembly protein PilX